MSQTGPSRRSSWWAPFAGEWPALLLLLAVVGALYVLTAARTVQGGDNGEFAMFGARAGVAHPSGYPIYVAFLRLASFLPSSTPAEGAARATALLGLAAVVALYWACRAFGAGRVYSLGAVGLYAVSPLAWDLATQAEVFTANALIAACLVLTSAPSSPFTGARRIFWLGVFAGAGLACHLGIVLLFPLGAFGLARGFVEAPRRIPALFLGLAGLLVAPLAYAWLGVESHRAWPDGWVWGGR